MLRWILSLYNIVLSNTYLYLTFELSDLREEEGEGEGEVESDEVLEPRIVTLEPGEKFLERYSVHEELGKGRYGVVHKVKGLNIISAFIVIDY